MIKSSAPSNIALIKYMGKVNADANVPSNSSLSYTLEHLRTTVGIEILESSGRGGEKTQDEWFPFEDEGLAKIELTGTGREKFLRHFSFLKKVFEIPGHHRVFSANNFPSDAGLASSASSFAALTKACAELKKSQDKHFQISTEKLSILSRQGSGSSCRSFFSPWAGWSGEGAHAVDLPIQELNHVVFILESAPKKISSSEAHRRVTTSPLFARDASGLSRVERAERRMQELQESLRSGTWVRSFQICWDEFWDMHELFHTANPGFTYLTETSRAVLDSMKKRWDSENVGPLVTLDAGPNIHCLFQKNELELAKDWVREFQSRAGNQMIASWAKN